MFLQEIANAEIKKKKWYYFVLYGLIVHCFPEKSKNILPTGYVDVQDCGGELLRKIMNFPEKKCKAF